ncbi:hypothetical protein PLICRDRAFT_33150 [Plicaturopsis crispa FD-325 SS-3]|uniref:Helicase C-terminal domain-containing protein n=1 Tax=Plicaturopsis crispa FD-325 SS-3 TaxID=944288 RepID=A0A0C9T1D1_PLICR|nr:hypothetical protein PLICRDRAFT_33150 [Plicaturopsis crispa FD-325 SS-3]
MTPTGSGKTGFYTMYILVVLAAVADPLLCPTSRFPKNPCLMPNDTASDGNVQQAAKMSAVGLRVLAINSDTREAAQRCEREELWVTARTEPSVIIAGPEQLRSDEYEKALRDDKLYGRMCGLGFDEVQRLSFRQDFMQMGFVKAPTVRSGPPMDNICELLGLRNGTYHTIRRSNLRPEIQLLFCELTSPIDGDAFPKLHWNLDSARPRPTIVFAKSIYLGSRIWGDLMRQSSKKQATTGLSKAEGDRARKKQIIELGPVQRRGSRVSRRGSRLRVHDRYRHGLALGRSRHACACIIVGDIADADELNQKIGRAGRPRRLVSDPRGIIYTTSTRTRMAAALKAIPPDSTIGSEDRNVDDSMSFMLVAKCKTAAQNQLYNGSITEEPPCLCSSCRTDPPPLPRAACNCSGCIPEALPVLVKPAMSLSVAASIPKKKRFPKLMKAHGKLALDAFRVRMWRKRDKAATPILGQSLVLPDDVLKAILDGYNVYKNPPALATLLKGRTYHLCTYALMLNQISSTSSISLLSFELEAIGAAAKAASQVKAAAKAAEKKKRALEAEAEAELY